MKNKCYLLCLLLCFFSETLFSESFNRSISIDFQQMPIFEAIHTLAKIMHKNIVVSPEVKGIVTLRLQHVLAENAFLLLMETYHLTCLKKQDIWIVTPSLNLLKQQEEKQKIEEGKIASTNLETHIWQIRYARAEVIENIISDSQRSFLSKRGIIRVDSRTNTILVQDVEAYLFKIGKLVKKLDVPIPQVLVEVRLASVNVDFERELGIIFPTLNNKDFSLKNSSAIAKLSLGSLIDIKLAALESRGKAELISSPSLFTSNQQTASIESGEEIPYQEISKSGATAVTFKKAVLRLKVTPQILPNQKILLQLEVNQDKPNSRIILGVPTISTRQMNTNVLVSNGQTIVLGGIFEINQDHLTEDIPFLSKIPIIGLLFQQKSFVQNKRELLIFVTPKIVD